ncbi:MAG: ATP phosphoribosyltransferase regulatory subunit [Oscillospiraceae bacterium]|nr:ATP phosphoribosyltransferase regulatory subunit [Oscillospiraceae bacterium]
MDISYNAIGWEDRVTLALCTLFESFGYNRYRMAKFEPYDMYMENKNFLKSSSVITFPDSSGRLMALKPDVTMSVVKNTSAEEFSKKVYYAENVFRMERDTHEYREVKQIGLEFIGDDGFYPEAETILLAAKSLEILSSDFVLCVSHMDILHGLLEKCGADGKTAEAVIDAVSRRMPHKLSDTGLDESTLSLLSDMISLPADAKEAIAKLRELDICSCYVDELQKVYDVLENAGFADRMRIDFSIINDAHYYNGIAFAGYINGVPRDVLSGGRYDNLMTRFGKKQRALGFAVYIGALTRYFEKKNEFDADVLLVYGDKPVCEVLNAVEKIAASGKKVRAFRDKPDNFTAHETVIL